MSIETQRGQHWAIHPSRLGGFIAFGFGDRHVMSDGEELILHSINAAEARAIARQLLEAADYVEAWSQGRHG